MVTLFTVFFRTRWGNDSKCYFSETGLHNGMRGIKARYGADAIYRVELVAADPIDVTLAYTGKKGGIH